MGEILHCDDDKYFSKDVLRRSGAQVPSVLRRSFSGLGHFGKLMHSECINYDDNMWKATISSFRILNLLEVGENGRAWQS